VVTPLPPPVMMPPALASCPRSHTGRSTWIGQEMASSVQQKERLRSEACITASLIEIAKLPWADL
jgi:hypothetical protein